MYQNAANAIQRARKRKGLTQEALAEQSGYSPDSVRAWESGSRLASIEALGILGECLDASSWLTGVYLREQTSTLSELIPDFEVGKPLPEAAATYISYMLDFVDERFDRKLLKMVADGCIDELETPVYQDLIELGSRINQAYLTMRFSRGAPAMKKTY